MKITFLCPHCAAPVRASLPVSSFWQCPACDHRMALDTGDQTCPTQCGVCGGSEFFKKKDFPHNLGMGILLLACGISFITYAYYQTWLTWTILIGTALFDGLLYLWVGDALVCYRCNANYQGIPKNTPVPGFDLAIAEKYRQEKIRQKQLEADQISRSQSS